MNFGQNAKRIFTATLAVWMSGIVLFLCCKMPTAQAAEMESCPLAKKSHCLKSSEKNLEQSFGRENQTIDCCGFPAKIFDKARKIEKSPQSLIIAKTVEAVVVRFSIAEKTFKSRNFYQSFARNRANTYLQNRVFRI